jgi:1-phosphatidylinositol phosphodiesterase
MMQMSLTLINSSAVNLAVKFCGVDVELAPQQAKTSAVPVPQGEFLPLHVSSSKGDWSLEIAKGTSSKHELHYNVLNIANVYQHVEFDAGGHPAAMTLNFGPAFSSKNWMGQLDMGPDMTLAAITMPGSHDTGTWDATRASKCQSFDIAGQLNRGIRWLDLRLAVSGNDLRIWHGSEAQGVYLAADILPAIKTFLAENPTEVVIVSVVNVSWSYNYSEFDALLHKLLMAGVTPNKLYDQNAIPKLADVRGCVVLMRQDKEATFGIKASGWPDDEKGTVWNSTDNIFYSVQNCYKFGSDTLTAKWNLVEAQLENATNRADGEAWYVNYTSASRAPITDPDEIALATEQKGINYQLHAYLCRQAGPRYFGLLPMDFPESPDGLIKLLISMNKLKH